MAANLDHLHKAIGNIDVYGKSRGIEYVKHSIREVFLNAVKDVTVTLLTKHSVNPTDTNAVVHYTSLQALFTMLNGRAEPIEPPDDTQNNRLPTDHRFLRLYDSANLNDPSEGAYFMNRACTNTYNVLRIPAYIASFIRPHETTENSVEEERIREARDNLVCWRHYGDDGRGCSISIPVGLFTSNCHDLILRAVHYGSPAADEAAHQLRPAVEMLDKMISNTLDPDIQREVAIVIQDGLGEIPYLYKSRAYEYEQECRIIATESTFKDYGGISYDFEKRAGKSGRIRMYSRHACLNLTNILSTHTVITLGPDVPNVDYVEYALEQLLRSLDKRDLPIERSKISYRRT